MKKELNILSQFQIACDSISKLYEITAYGQRHSEVRLLKLLEKFGGTQSIATLARENIQEAVSEVNARSDAKKSPTRLIELTDQQFRFGTSVVLSGLRQIRAIPLLARFQTVTALSVAFEGFTADIIGEVFDINPLYLKSGKSTLNDSDLVDEICIGNAKPLTLLKNHRLRSIMYGSVGHWFKFMRKDFGMNIEENDTLKELFLVRNAIVHNNSRVSRELVASGLKRYKTLDRKLNVTENDLDRYIKNSLLAAENIWAERVRKFSEKGSAITV